MSSSEEGTGARRYTTPVRDARAAATRSRIRSTAEALFLEHGYVRTSMSRIAKAAGVAEKTVYLAFPTKAALLNDIIVSSIQSEGPGRPFREQMQQALAAPPARLIEVFAEANAQLMSRTARVMALGESAAPTDPQLAELRERGHNAMRSDFRAVAEALAAHGALSDDIDVDSAAATIYALVNESVYLRLVDGLAWTPDHYGDWLARTLARALLAHAAR
jgi:AcrR family transcriptional regulator